MSEPTKNMCEETEQREENEQSEKGDQCEENERCEENKKMMERAEAFSARLGNFITIQNPLLEIRESENKVSAMFREHFKKEAKIFLYTAIKLWRKLGVPGNYIRDMLEEVGLDEDEKLFPYACINRDDKTGEIHKIFVDVAKSSTFPMEGYDIGYDRTDDEYLVWGLPHIELLQRFGDFIRSFYARSKKMARFCARNHIHKGVFSGTNMCDAQIIYGSKRKWKVCLNYEKINGNEVGQ